jgi:RimJ/RimL family protein N-acetyltransferase
LAIVPVDIRRPVGVVGLFGLSRADGPRLGYWVVHERRGRGFATEAARLLVEWALAQAAFERLFIDVEPGNVASARVAERLGGRRRERRTERLTDGRSVELDRFVIEAGPP